MLANAIPIVGQDPSILAGAMRSVRAAFCTDVSMFGHAIGNAHALVGGAHSKFTSLSFPVKSERVVACLRISEISLGLSILIPRPLPFLIYFSPTSFDFPLYASTLPSVRGYTIARCLFHLRTRALRFLKDFSLTSFYFPFFVFTLPSVRGYTPLYASTLG